MRKFLALVLSCILTVGAVSTVANAAKFTDVPASDEALTKAVDLLSSVGITTGTTETTFGTSEGVTRQQMATFIYRLMKAGKTTEGREGDNSTSFTDLDDPFYYFMISWANEMGIIKGRNETTFDPKGGIILQDAYVMIVRALGYEKKKTLDYPFDYIEIAENIGLDEGLPATVTYDTPLTRGNVAVLLYNAFYADMATGETGYRTIYESVEVSPGVNKVAEKGQEPYTIYDTVAEKIFGIKKTVQRVVATPNYSLDDDAKTDGNPEDEVMVTVKCFDKEYVDTDNGLFGTIAFADLGLPGEADDYFLFDLSIYYKQVDDETPEIVSATSLGTYKKAIPGSRVRFESLPFDSNFAYQSDGNYDPATGKVTIDGRVNYLFDAPWSYSKPTDMSKKDDECITLLWLDKTDRDPEEEDYVMDYNFKAHRDVLGRGKDDYDVIPSLYDNTKTGKWNQEANKVSETMVESDLRGYGIYSMGAMSSLMQINYTSTNFEADAWDSNSDGKYDYLWLKPYTIGQVCIDEGEPFMDRHASGYDVISAVYNAGEVPTIYTYGATAEGVVFKDGQLVTGYINGPANYVKIATAIEMQYTENQTYDTQSGVDGGTFGFNGSSTGRNGLARQYIGFPMNTGARSSMKSPGGVPDYSTSNKNMLEFGQTYDIVFVNNAMFHVKATKTLLGDGDDYAIIMPNSEGIYAFTTAVGIVEDGDLQASGHILDVMIDGEVTTVFVKPQTSSKLASDNTITYKKLDDNNKMVDVTKSLMPVTDHIEEADIYDFSDYVGKLLTYTVNSDGAYTFKIAPLEGNQDASVLLSDDADYYYTFEADENGTNTAAFVNSSGDLYQFVKTGSPSEQWLDTPSKYVIFTENTKVVIKTEDDEGDPKFTIYDYENKPNFDSSNGLQRIKYIVRNNPKSTSIEELIYLYAEAKEGTTVKVGNTLDFRFVKGVKTVKKEDATVLYYDVYNPFTAKIEEEYEAYSSETANCVTNGIYTISGGYIYDKNLLGKINELGNIADSSTTKNTTDLGLVELGAYDEDNKLLTIETDGRVCLVDDKTVISFIDLDNETIEKKTDNILSSKSASYRCNDDRNLLLRAFVATSEIKKVDDYEYAEAICIVRYNFATTTTVSE